MVMVSSKAGAFIVCTLAGMVGSSAFAPNMPPSCFTPSSTAARAGRKCFHALGNQGFSLRGAPISAMQMAESIQKFGKDSDVSSLEKTLSNCQYWSCLPSQLTMYTDLPETFHLVKGKVAVMPVNIKNGVPIGDAVEFEEGEYGVVPAGAFRWDVQKPSTKSTNCREGIQLTTKGWREESPIESLRGQGTLSTQGRTSEDDLKYLEDLVSSKGVPPKSSWENAVQYKLDRDVYCANLSFVVTDKGIIVQDRVSEKNLKVLGEDGFKPYDEKETYVETEGSKRWTKDGNFEKSAFIIEK